MSLLESLALDAGDFSRAFDSLHNMLICRTVGDCSSYDAFFLKQCSEQNPEALLIKTDIDFFAATDTTINKSLAWCATYGHYKFVSIMHMLHKMHALEVTPRVGFGVCVLDGLIFQRGLEFTDASSHISFCVNHKYEGFMYSFWTVANMHAICTGRIAHLNAAGSREASILLTVEKTREQLPQGDRYKDLFLWAYRMVRDCLHLSIREIEKTQNVALQL